MFNRVFMSISLAITYPPRNSGVAFVMVYSLECERRAALVGIQFKERSQKIWFYNYVSELCIGAADILRVKGKLINDVTIYVSSWLVINSLILKLLNVYKRF